MKIDKHLAHIGYCSRRKAQELLEDKRILVNGQVATFKTEVVERDTILVDGRELQFKSATPVYIMYHKPKGIICTTEKIEGNIVDAINHKEKIYPIGRLDKDSEGLILLTNQGKIIDKIANSENGHEKEYIVTLNLPVRNKFLKEISEGVDLKGERTKPCKVSLEPNAKRIFRITLTQGLNRQIRRMCNMFDYQVIKLQRVRVMNIALGKLKPGEWRDLTEEELSGLFDQIN
jgi:23S rRNA pseudouridine2604 synthase